MAFSGTNLADADFYIFLPKVMVILNGNHFINVYARWKPGIFMMPN